MEAAATVKEKKLRYCAGMRSGTSRGSFFLKMAWQGFK
jgi:hypothetical protein